MNSRLTETFAAEDIALAPRLYAVASGKGGVGKSVTAFNLACSLARNHRVLLVDGDFQMGNQHILANASPGKGWQDVCLGRCELREAVVAVRDNLDLLASISDRPEELLPEIKSLAVSLADLRRRAERYKYVIIDTASGILPHTHLVLNTVDEIILMTTPELTSLTDCYALYKILVINNRRIKISLLINREDKPENREYIHRKFGVIGEQFLGRTPGCAGGLSHDLVMIDSVAQQKGVAEYAPNSIIAKEFAELAGRLAGPLEKPSFNPETINSNPSGADIRE